MSQNLSLSEIFPLHASSRFALPSEVPGLAARRIAADILDGVLHKQRTLDDQLDGAGAHPGLKTLSDRDRALMRRLVATILRRLGTLGHVLSRLLDRGIPTDAPRAQSALLIGAAQILWMDVPDHAAVDLSVRLVQSDRRAAKYAGLVNAVLRRCAREGQPLIDEVKAQTLDVPPWLMARWIAHYGETTARQIALAHRPRAVARSHREIRRRRSGRRGCTAKCCRPERVRTLLQGSVKMLPGFADGQWWVQDAAAALPARLFGDVNGKTHRRSLRRARRQDRAAGAGRRARHRDRPLAGAGGAAARKSGAAVAARPRPWWPMPPNGRATATAASTACWSMRPAPRPAPSAAIPTSPG